MRSGSLRRRRDFARVQAEGAQARSSAVVVFVAPRPDRMAPSRVGLAVARGAGTAVARNRIRRRLRAAWRRTGAPTGLDVVIRARPEAIDAPFQELVDVLAEGQRVVKRPP